ncbi:MAG: serine hydrolase domain-containing protein [Bryobacteraceae bacterium]
MLSRRAFASTVAALPLRARVSIDDTLSRGMERRRIPCVAAMAADSRRVLYQGAFGTRDAESSLPIKPDSIFAIASMTKAITTVAALQLVEKKKVTLDEPAEKHLPELRGKQVLAGFDPVTGQARLRPPARPVTLHHLLTHTSGLCYALWDRDRQRWDSSPGVNSSTPAPLIFDPGTRWQYGQGIDLAGRLVENVSGLSLEDYFQQHILKPLGMPDTSFIVPPAKFDRVVTGYRRQPDGSLKPNDRKQPDPPKSFNGGGGLYSTAPDYVRFMQAILKHGQGILSRPSVKLMTTNQIGNVRAGILKTTTPEISADMDVHPGESDRFTLGFLMNVTPHHGGRSAGSLAWAGISNTFYWIDPARDRCGVIMMQFLPFVDAEAVGLLREFEQAVYA